MQSPTSDALTLILVCPRTPFTTSVRGSASSITYFPHKIAYK